MSVVDIVGQLNARSEYCRSAKCLLGNYQLSSGNGRVYVYSGKCPVTVLMEDVFCLNILWFENGKAKCCVFNEVI